MDYNITADDIDLKSRIAERRTYFDEKFSSTAQQAEMALSSLKESLELSEFFTLEKNKVMWNTACYIGIISLDLKIISKHQAFADTEWEKRFFSRQAALLIYESIDDLQWFFGKSFKTLSNDFSGKENYDHELKGVRKGLNEFKDRHYKRLQAIRNTAIAHRDKVTLDQLELICSINWLDSMNLCSEFDLLINHIGRFLEQMMRNGISDDDIQFTAY